MRITKDVAEETAKKMISKKSLELKKLSSDFSDKIRKMKVKQIPKNVIETYEYFPDYFNACFSVYLKGVGFNNDCIKVQKYPYNGNYYLELNSNTSVVSNELLKQFNKIKSLEKEIKDLKLEIETALYSTLRTYKRVEESFPEALEFLPPMNNNKTALVVNLSSLRDKIK
jgi:hypothetical protein